MGSKRGRARLRRSAGAGVPLVATPSVDAIDEALRELLVDRGVNVLAIAGGDGTVHHVINSLLDLQRLHEQALHGQQRREEGAMPRGPNVEPQEEGLSASGRHRADARPIIPFPRLLVLNGGTLNIIGRTVGIHGPPHHTLRRFAAYFGAAPLERVPARRVSLMRVDREGAATPRYGCVFGSETLYHAIELYVRFGAGYRGLARFLAELGRGATTGSQLWREEGWKLGPFDHPITVDGEAFATYTAVVASTVDLTLAVSAIRAIRRPLGARGFHAKLICEGDPLALVRQVPALMSERGSAGVVDFREAQQLDLAGPYTLDGECFEDPGPGRSNLTVSTAAYVLPLVPGEFGATRW